MFAAFFKTDATHLTPVQRMEVGMSPGFHSPVFPVEREPGPFLEKDRQTAGMILHMKIQGDRFCRRVQ